MAGDVSKLVVFQRAYALSLVLHQASHGFPKLEQYGGIADQLRRSSKAVCAMLAEGSGRQRLSDAEFRRYVMMALGSADETTLWCRYAQDLGYAGPGAAEAWQAECVEIARMLQGLLARLKTGD